PILFFGGSTCSEMRKRGHPMTDSPFWMIVPGNAALSALVIFVIAMPFLYAARRPVHDFVRSLGHLAQGPLKLISRWLLAAAKEKNGNELVQRVLDEINTSIKEIHAKTLAEYRAAYEERHRILNSFMPFWRSLDKTLSAADRKMSDLNGKAAQIDAQIAKYE